VVLTGTPNPVFLDNPVAYSVTVTGTSSVTNPNPPTGTVTFMDGNYTLGTATLVSGVASITATPWKNVGTHNIVAEYSGDGSYSPASSNVVAEVVEDFSIAVPNPASAALYPGATGTFVIPFSPVNGGTFPAAVALSVSGAPAGSAVTLSSSTLAAGAGTTNITLTVTPASLTASAKPAPGLGSKLAPISFALLLLPVFGIRRMRKTWQRYLAVLILLVGGLAATAGLSGCSSTPSGYFGQGGSIYDYNVTVTGTVGGLTHSTVITLTVN
jgi:hypothetical protein